MPTKSTPTPRTLGWAPLPNIEEDTSSDYVPRLQLLLREIGHRYTEPPPPNHKFLNSFHEWLHFTLGPVSGPSWKGKKLLVLEDSSTAVIERAYPYADTEMKFLMAKLTAMVIVMDDSLDDDEMYDQISQFAHRLYLGEAQPPGLLSLYHQSMKEMSQFHEGDAILRGLAVVPWISFADACLLEKRMLTVDHSLRASPLDMGFQRLAMHRRLSSFAASSGSSSSASSDEESSFEASNRRSSIPYMKGIGHTNGKATPLEGSAMKFPHYLRYKTGLGEAYAAAIFKTSKGQQLPLSRYIKALPDLSFFIEIMNDLLSFHKEQLAGETTNLIHLRTQALRDALDHAPGAGSGRSGEWTLTDTFNVLCDEVRDATQRIDSLLRLEECEERERNGEYDGDPDDMDMAIARQWRGWRDGYISWHLESQRYKLDFIRPTQFYDREWD